MADISYTEPVVDTEYLYLLTPADTRSNPLSAPSGTYSFDDVSGAVKSGINKARDAADYVNTAFNAVGNTITGYTDPAVSAIQGFADPAIDVVKDFASPAINAVEYAANAYDTGKKAVTDFATDLVGSVGADAAFDALSGLVSGGPIGAVVNTGIGFLDDAFGAAGKTMQNVATGAMLGGTFVPGLGHLAGGLIGGLFGPGGSQVATTQDIRDAFNQVTQSVGTVPHLSGFTLNMPKDYTAANNFVAGGRYASPAVRNLAVKRGYVTAADQAGWGSAGTDYGTAVDRAAAQAANTWGGVAGSGIGGTATDVANTAMSRDAEAASVGAHSSQKGSNSSSSSSGGSILCTAAHATGNLSRKDLVFATKYRKENIPDYAYYGYLTWAKPLVAVGTKSKLFKKLGDAFAIAWVEWTKGNKTLLGAFTKYVLLPLSYLVGFFVDQSKFKTSTEERA